MARYVPPPTNGEQAYHDGAHADEGNIVSDSGLDMSEMGAIMAALKMGTTMTKLPLRAKQRPEQKTFQLNLDEFKISWFRGAGSKEEGFSESQQIFSFLFHSVVISCHLPSINFTKA